MAWISPPDFVAGSVVSESDMDTLSGDLTYLLSGRGSTVKYTGGNITSASLSSWMDVDATNVKIVRTTASTLVLVGANVLFTSGATSQVGYLEVDLDGVLYGGASSTGIVRTPVLASAAVGALSFVIPIAVTAASHTFKLKWQITGSAGTGTLTAGTTSPLTFWVLEIA